MAHLPEPLDRLALTRPALSALLDRLGIGARHAGRVFAGLHRHHLPLEAIPDLGRHAATLAAATQQAEVVVESAHQSPDGTEKLVFRLGDGARVEGVLIPMRPGRNGRAGPMGDPAVDPASPFARTTLCVSSQVGCAMACTFCATGTLGLTRGLTAGEIVAQVHAARARLQARGGRVTHVVFMGMGEPLHHYAATRDAVHILLDPHGPCFPARHLTVSTVGIVPKIQALAGEFGGRIQLALSLHAGTDATRQRIIPLAATYDLATLKAALAAWPLPGSRALMLEYVVLPGVNDGADELAALADWVGDLRAVVNLIPFNPFPSAPFRAPTVAEVEAAAARLKAHKVPHTVRWPRGREVAGACGQLALEAGASD